MKGRACWLAAAMLAVVCAGCRWWSSSGDDDDDGGGSSSSAVSGGGGQFSNPISAASDASQKVTPSVSARWAYSAASPVYEVQSSVSSLTVSNLSAGQVIYVAKTNPTAAAVAASYTQYVSGASNVTLNSAAARAAAEGVPGGVAAGTRHFVPPQTFGSKVPLAGSAARAIGTSITSGSTVPQLNLSVGSTTKEVYIDADSAISTFRQATATLRGVGTYCNVWVVNGYYAGESTGTRTYTGSSATYAAAGDEQVSSSFVSECVSAFDKMYPKIRNVFGNESDSVYYAYANGSFSTAAMNYLSDTGTKVNIVIYDIGADHAAGDSSGVVGYFYPKDYYPNGSHIKALSGGIGYGNSDLNYSNEGKYFYVDAYYSAAYPSTVYSTLAHEFQHMIHFGVKAMGMGLSSSTWYDEMLSMLCEDVMQSHLGISNDDSPVERLPLFAGCYRHGGLEYRSSSDVLTLLSYAGSYAFGAWVLRQYGGVPVLAEMASNAAVDVPSVVAAVNAVNGTGHTIASLLEQYAEACVFSANPSGSYTAPTFNQSRSGTRGGYTYSLGAINLWDLGGALPGLYETCGSANTEYCKFDGPALYAYNARYDIRPYGMTLVQVGAVSASGSVTLSFGAASVSASERLYVLVR